NNTSESNRPIYSTFWDQSSGWADAGNIGSGLSKSVTNYGPSVYPITSSSGTNRLVLVFADSKDHHRLYYSVSNEAPDFVMSSTAGFTWSSPQLLIKDSTSDSIFVGNSAIGTMNVSWVSKKNGPVVTQFSVDDAS
ncbi:MAG: hypothetical protein AAF497_26575, partial [Planctomycetota bacterium]